MTVRRGAPRRAQRLQRAQGVAYVALSLALASLIASAGCKEDSYALVSVLTRSGTLSGVAQFRVYVDNGPDSSTLYYPRQLTESLVLDTTDPVTFSVQFSTSRGGPTTFGVEPLDVASTVLGYGEAKAAIEKEKVFKVTVLVEPGAVRPVQGMDGGCDPYQPAITCGAGHTCGLLCSDGQPAVGMCYVAGPALPGQTCASNNDCSPGSQCFTFSASGCPVMTCLRFCQGDAACGEAGAYCNLHDPLRHGLHGVLATLRSHGHRHPGLRGGASLLRLLRRNHGLRLPRSRRPGIGLHPEPRL